MLSMCVPSSARRCKKWGRIYPASPSHRLPAADVLVIFFVIGGGGGKKRWRTEGVEVEEEAGRRCVPIGGSNGGDHLDRLRDPEADHREHWESPSESRPGVWVAEEARPVVGVCSLESELRQVGDVDLEGRGEGEGEATATAATATCRAEDVKGATMEVNAEEGLVCAAAVEDEVVARGLPGCEVGCFDVELNDGAKGCERTV